MTGEAMDSSDTMARRRDLLRTSGLALAALAGCAGGGEDRPENTVGMTADFRFAPAELSVPPGTTVTWVNESEVGHSVTAYADRIPPEAEYFASGGVDSEKEARAEAGGELIPAGGKYSHTFEVAGSYEYFCVPHESTGMVASVTVG